MGTRSCRLARPGRAASAERVIAQIDVRFSNSMIEAWFRSIKHQWLFLHQLSDLATVKRLIEFYVTEHNTVLPHSAFHGQTPDEKYFGQGDAVPVNSPPRGRMPGDGASSGSKRWRAAHVHGVRCYPRTTSPHEVYAALKT